MSISKGSIKDLEKVKPDQAFAWFDEGLGKVLDTDIENDLKKLLEIYRKEFNKLKEYENFIRPLMSSTQKDKYIKYLEEK